MVWNEYDLDYCKQLTNDLKVTYLIISTLDQTSEKHTDKNGREI